MLQQVLGIVTSVTDLLARKASREPCWRSTLERTIRELEGLNRSTERDFLMVGGKLREFLIAARKISAAMSGVADLISGEHGRQASQALHRIRERATDMGARVEHSSQALAAMREYSSRVRQAFSKMSETVSIFRTLCTLTRVETARLGDNASSLSDLAEQVKPLSERIQASGERVLASSKELERSVKIALRNGSEVSVRELAELDVLIASVVEGLKSFEERQQLAMGASSRQAAQHEEVCKAIEDLVESIQFHDITRQQIEHVCQALQEFHSEVQDSARSSSLPPAERGTILNLQYAQLAGAALAFQSSIGRMTRDLEGIAARVSNMAEASQTLMGFSEGEKDSFFQRMEGFFTGILKALGSCFAAEGTLQATASGLEETIRGMEEAVRDIRGIELQIQRTAINATIGSAHIGSAGNALNVIADVMHHVALDSDANSDGVAEALGEMRNAVERVAGRSGLKISGDAPESATGEMREAIRELHASSEASFSRVNEIAALSAQLSHDIRSVCDSLSVGELFADVVGHAQNELARLGARTRTDRIAAASIALPQDVERFAKHYTMKSEREVHQRVTGGHHQAMTGGHNQAMTGGHESEDHDRETESAIPEPAELAMVFAGMTGSEFGDNVELF